MTLDTYIVPLALIGIGLLIAMIKWPKVWITSLLFYLPMFLTDTGKGLTARELAMGGFYAGTILVWMVWSFGRPDRRLVRNWMDFLVLAYVVLMLGNLPIALLNDIPILHWVSDYAVVCLVLYYFPIREYFTEQEDFRQLMILASISAVLMSLYTFYHYRQRMLESGLMYAYQLQASRSVTLAPIHSLALLYAIVALQFVGRKAKLGLALVIATNAAALFLSFGRTLWALFGVCLGIAMIFLSGRQRLRIVLGSIVAIGLAIAAAYQWNPKLTQIGINLIKRRIESTSQLSGGDYSFETRLVEAQSAWRTTREHPLGGNGLRTVIVAYHPTDQHHVETTFVHVGYLGLAMRLGFPMLFLMVAILLGFTFTAWRGAVSLRWTDDDRLYRMAAVVMLANTPVVYVNIFMSSIFDQRYGNIMFAFIFACTAIVHAYLDRRRQDLPTVPSST